MSKRFCVFVIAVLIAFLEHSAFASSSSPFDVAELTIQASPTEAQTLALPSSDKVVDLDIALDRPEAAILIKTQDQGQKVVFWKIGSTTQLSQLPSQSIPNDLSVASIAWHPSGKEVFMLGSRGGQFEILKATVEPWKLTSIYKTKQAIRRLVVGPRPFSKLYEGPKAFYRLFFGVKKEEGRYSIHSITETGQHEYAVIDSVGSEEAKGLTSPLIYLTDIEFPNTLVAPSSLPVGFHPSGLFMVWEDSKHCFQKARYEEVNWRKLDPIWKDKKICAGSVTYTPNGAALIQWHSNTPGVKLIYDRGAKTETVAQAYTFLGTPSSVPDGRGIVGVVKAANGLTVQYAPIATPLADVVNAWMFLESPKDRELLTANTGLFREVKNRYEQLYQLYESESYACRSYDSRTPARPYLVSTDIFWEVYAAAFEGIFVLTERQSAVPAFWSFIDAANGSLKTTQAGTKMAKAFEAVAALKAGRHDNLEAEKIRQSSGIAVSAVTGESFDYNHLKPRSHYAVDEELKTYFRASKYLMGIRLTDKDVAALRALPQSVMGKALAWISAYKPFIALSRAPLVWEKVATPPLDYASELKPQPQFFPLSWGLDNEVLYSTVYHANKPENRQIQGPGGRRLLPSGVDLAAALGSRFAEVILEEAGEFKNFPPLQAEIAELRKRFGNSKTDKNPNGSIYQKWISALGVQWSNQVASPSNVIQEKFWQAKRLQTGLASWATLRHATLLVNKSIAAECGETGFEEIILRPPRGFVEPDPDTFEAVAGLFDFTATALRSIGKTWKGANPEMRDGVIRRLAESASKARLFRDIAKKELQNTPLTNQEYEEILYVGRAAEHNFLIFKSILQKDQGLAQPDPIQKVADVAQATPSGGPFLLVGVGSPLEWDQIVPFFGRKQIVKGVTYSYYETSSPEVLSDSQWKGKLESITRPAWVQRYMSNDALSCPPKDY